MPEVTAGMASDMLIVWEVTSESAGNRSINTFPQFGKDLHIW